MNSKESKDVVKCYDLLFKSISSDVKKVFGGDVLPFSAVDRFYCEKTIEYIINLSKNS